MKSLLITLITLALMSFNADDTSFYEFKVKNIDDEEVALEEYKGKVILIVNTASQCGYTPQYEGLQAIYEKYQDQGLVIMGFPANNFNGQEPGSNEEIKQFCTLNYSVKFPMFSKVSVKGEDQAELFTYLTSQENQDFTGEIKWNFEKFLISRNGNLKRRFRSSVTPESEEITSAIEAELNM
ncbi:glutathione peroxidase [Balneola sp. MJW-20]|uniref:glutathione peroxidase n=1 Tax=Gracilimonas aurantiaca TaxID=3234185 RepID=UPI0038B2F107